MEKASIQSHRGEVREETIVPLSDSDLYVKGEGGRKGGGLCKFNSAFPFPLPQPTNQCDMSLFGAHGNRPLLSTPFFWPMAP